MIKKKLRKAPLLFNLLKKGKRVIHKTIFLVIAVFTKVDKNKIVFKSFNGKSYSCNPCAISEELYKQYSNMQIVWLFNHPHDKVDSVPSHICKVKNGSMKALYHQYTAKFWIDNFQKDKSTFKRKKQIYIQTWHGDRAFKKILFDSGSEKNKDPNRLIENHSCDLMVAGSSFGEKLLRSAFRYHGKILDYGSPRNDKLVNQNQTMLNQIKLRLGINKETKVLLFAPTFRKESQDKTQKINELDLNEVLKTLEKNSKFNWICLTRAHSSSRKLEFEMNDYDKIIDVSQYEDMADLLQITDFLITDYSSSAGDFVLRKKPIILFQPDKEEYENKDRNFYIPIEDTPFFTAESQKELIHWIENVEKEKVIQNCEEIMNFYGFYETGNASKKVVEYIASKF